MALRPTALLASLLSRKSRRFSRSGLFLPSAFFAGHDLPETVVVVVGCVVVVVVATGIIEVVVAMTEVVAVSKLVVVVGSVVVVVACVVVVVGCVVVVVGCVVVVVGCVVVVVGCVDVVVGCVVVVVVETEVVVEVDVVVNILKTYADPWCVFEPMSAQAAPTTIVPPLIATEEPKRSPAAPSKAISVAVGVIFAQPVAGFTKT